jgi:hypothetical protein
MSAWIYKVTDAQYGIVPTVNVQATRKCGRVVEFTASLFPAGWRMNTMGAPAAVAREALAMAKQVW